MEWISLDTQNDIEYLMKRIQYAHLSTCHRDVMAATSLMEGYTTTITLSRMDHVVIFT